MPDPEMSDPQLPDPQLPDLERFVTAQEVNWDDARAELADGHKRTHWMWYVFPQLTALGRSSTARFYGIEGPEEARAYLAHPVLGPRLLEATRIVASSPTPTAEELMGEVDAVKLRSSMALFAAVAPEQTCFTEVLDRYYDGHRDDLTLSLLAG